MGFQQEYDTIIQIIEAGIRKPADEIKEDVYRSIGRGKRSTNEIFQFISGYYLHEYINYRKAQNCIDHAVKTGRSLDETVTEEYCFGEYTSFSRFFKKYIGVKPIDLVSGKEKADWVPPLYIDTLLTRGQKSKDMAGNCRIEMDITDYHAYELVDEKRSYYGLTAEAAVEAYNISKHYHVDLDDTFECFVDWQPEGANGKSGFLRSAFEESIQISKELDLRIPDIYWDVREGFSKEDIVLKLELLEKGYFGKEDLDWMSFLEINDIRNLLKEAEKRKWNIRHAIEFYKRNRFPINQFIELYSLNGLSEDYTYDELELMKCSLQYQGLEVGDVTREYLDIAIPLGGDLDFELFKEINETYERMFHSETIPADTYGAVLDDLEEWTDSVEEALESHFWYIVSSADLMVGSNSEEEELDSYFDNREYLASITEKADNDKTGEKYEYFADDNYTGDPKDVKDPAYYYEGSGEAEDENSIIW